MKIIFAADMSFNYIQTLPTQEFARTAMREASKLFALADASMLNLENVFGNADEHTPIVKNGPNLISSPIFAEYLRALRPTVVGLANNHTKDFGEAPMLFTKELLEKDGMSVIGAGKNIEEAYRPAFLEKDGVKLSILAVCENEFGTADEERSGTAGYRLSLVSRFITDAKASGAHPIVYFHGGHETYPYPSPARVELYRHFVDLGAAAVICMHTHCPQGYEIYQGAPIVYSMGNFFFPRFPGVTKDSSWYHGYMSELDILASGVTLTIHPYRFDENGIRLLCGEERAHFDAYMEYINSPISSPKELRAWFDSWCLVPSRRGYYQALSDFSPEQIADGNAALITCVKNVFGCEAHNELVKNMLAMIYDGRIESARAGVEKILALQDMKIPE